MRRYSLLFSIAILICILLRIIIFVHYNPKKNADTLTYELLAQRISKLDLTGYDGDRTPVYPLLLALCKNNYKIVFFVQCLLGISTSILLFRLTYLSTGNEVAASIVALSYSLAIFWLSYEIYILTEVLSIFLTVLFITLFEAAIRKNSSTLYLLVGIIAAVATLTRPLLIVLPVTGFIFLAYLLIKQHKIIRTGPYVLPIIVLISGWCYVNKINTGYFTITTLSGYSLSNHSGGFMEKAPDKYRVIRDMYIEGRAKRIRQTGNHEMTIFKIDNEIRKRTGYTFAQLGEQLTRLSLELFTNHPFLYLRSVMISWINFWRPPGPSNQVVLARSGYTKIIFYLEALGLAVICLIFLILSVLIFTPFRSRLQLTTLDYLCFTIVWSASIIQALMEHGDNARYGLSFHAVTLYVVISTLTRLKRERVPDS